MYDTNGNVHQEEHETQNEQVMDGHGTSAILGSGMATRTRMGAVNMRLNAIIWSYTW